MREVAGHALLREGEHELLRAIDEILCLSGPLLPEPRDLVTDPHEAAERRHLLDDARVVLDVRGGRDQRRELGDAPEPPTASSSPARRARPRA